MMEPKRWEKVAAGTTRLEVPGGWLYRVTVTTRLYDKTSTKVESVVFVPEPKES